MPTPGPFLLLHRDARALISLARSCLGMSQEQFGIALGASKRTATRWDSGRANPSIGQVRELAALVYPRDPSLAAELAVAAGTTLESLGIVAPAPPAPAPPALPPPPPPRLVVQAVVCAAADALQVPPSTVRAALLAAFRTAHELRFTVEDVEKALAADVERTPASG
jgi:DNA-binding XRE family transcriptional regulator